jgi:hypothetical protein
MGSGAMIYIPSFMKTGSDIQKLIGGGGSSQRHRQHSDLISLLLCFQNKKSRGTNLVAVWNLYFNLMAIANERLEL